MGTPSRILRAAAAAALAMLLPAALAATPATAAPPKPVVYDALGDSYASGYGVPPYLDACGRTDAAYAVQIDGRMRIHLDDFAACAGAKTTDLLANQLSALDADTTLVTVSIGGNDIRWGDAVGACLTLGDAQCAGALQFTTAVIRNVLPGLLHATYSQVATAAPNAHVVVTGYPRLFSPQYGDYYAASPAEQRAMNDGADLLNAVISDAAREHGFQFVDVTKRFIDHGVNAPEPWILGVADPGRFHPNLEGYEAYAAAVTASVNPRDLR